ncbi:MAG: hypothetical protein QUS12_15240 [Methanosarcina sp.]|uniref:hypothetical protein n=1 Tax=Methanosarcina sp. TaxID=2213 RepID=UPI002CB4380A|nr:hypothetical protein [Methanosarcina sp.]MDM7920494.1 hypothetical protein [Methanosarcina sp.]HOW13940.1 hypothetical protein [Methanosarcina sp.]
MKVLIHMLKTISFWLMNLNFHFRAVKIAELFVNGLIQDSSSASSFLLYIVAFDKKHTPIAGIKITR